MTIKKTIMEARFAIGTYHPTVVDERKANAQIRITATTSRGYEVMTNLPLKGRGIKLVGCAYVVTEVALKSLQKLYTTATDF